MRILNTILLFFVGVLMGIYLGVEKSYFKKFFSKFEDYNPVYYRKPNNNKVNDYTPVYTKKMNSLNDSLAKKDEVSSSLKDYKILEELKSADNPVGDDFEFIESTERVMDNTDEVKISDFVEDSLKFAGRTIRGKNLFLLRTEKKNGKLFFFFSLQLKGKEYYLIIEGDERFEKDYGKGMYDVKFVSEEGLLVEGNKMVSIYPEKQN